MKRKKWCWEHLWNLNKQYEAAVDAGEFECCNDLEVAIHKYIAQTADCPLLAEELGRLLLIERTAAHKIGPRQPLEVVRTEHRAVIQAIIDHDADSAEYLMKKHIQTR